MYRIESSMLTKSHVRNHQGTKRSGASASMYSCVRQGQPSNAIFAGLLPTDWEEAGP
jgi:hypothetical protein